MLEIFPTPKPQPVGTSLVRLIDVPEEIRISAARKLMAEAKDADEWRKLFYLAHDPGDAGGRIAA